MLIQYVEICNFRKLKSVRIDFAEEKTVLVGANNSGKTSAMIALHRFLVSQHEFTTNDFTLSHWKDIDQIGECWESQDSNQNSLYLSSSEWEKLLPSLDVWISVAMNEIHYVRDLLPTLEWAGGSIGVRLRFEPTSLDNLRKEYLSSRIAANKTRQMAGGSNTTMTVKLWPNDLHDFLERRLKTHFEVRLYTLDPGKQSPPENGIAKPQSLSSEIDPLESNPLRKLIRIDEISAHRGLSSSSPNPSANETDRIRAQRRGWLSDQLRDYYEKHLDPTEFPDHSDLEALKAIEDAQAAFDCRLEAGFSQALDELKGLNYPGVTDPQIKIATRLRPTDGLTHNSAVQYSVLPENDSNPAPPLRLPEEYNGLGYQNLISMVFNLMSFRDAWMRVGKAGRTNIGMEAEYFIPPLHLVLVEEPEVHLHCQVQQVFVRQAYNVLRNHNDLKDIKDLRTQLLVSTHSSHVAHEVDFACLRYFRRLFAENSVEVPISSVVNLSEVFGKEDETKKFVTRYLRTTHADLFFADAAILVEGPAERLLVPHFIRAHYPTLDRCYISLLEIGGRHAHRLKPLIEHLGLTTLIITDLDSAESAGHHKKALPELGKNQVTTNPTLKTWFPKKSSIDELLDLPEVNKIYESPENKFSVRVAYQIPISYYDGNGSQSSSLANTLEIALILENLQLFSELTYDGPIKDIRDAIHRNKDQSSLLKALFKMLTKFDKAAFALDLLFLIEPAKLTIPGYIKYGLDWLHSRFADSPKIALNNESHLELNGDA